LIEAADGQVNDAANCAYLCDWPSAEQFPRVLEVSHRLIKITGCLSDSQVSDRCLHDEVLLWVEGCYVSSGAMAAIMPPSLDDQSRRRGLVFS
jgi:hypothetical protein